MHPVQDPAIPEFVTHLQRIDTYAEIEEVMKSPDFAMAGAPERTIFLEDTLIMSEGARHTELKQLVAPLFSRQAIAYYELHLVDPVIKAVLSETAMKPDADGKTRIDIVPMIHAALTRIAAAVTGVDGIDTPERTEHFKTLVLALSTATTGSFAAKNPDRIIQAGRDAMDVLVRDYLQASLDRRVALAADHRAGRVAKEDLPRDLLMTMCLAGDLTHDDDGDKIPYVWRSCALFLTASIKTTSHSLPHLFVHIDEWIREHPQDRAKLTDTEFLHRAAAESFRLHQTAPARFRAAIRDVTLTTGRHVAAGEMVALHPPVANVSAEVFGPDGRFFNPYRETPKGLRPWGMSFGLGAHNCMGQNLVTGIQNRGDERHGTQGTAVRFARALYELGAELDPDNPPRRIENSMHDSWDSVPVILHAA